MKINFETTVLWKLTREHRKKKKWGTNNEKTKLHGYDNQNKNIKKNAIEESPWNNRTNN